MRAPLVACVVAFVLVTGLACKQGDLRVVGLQFYPKGRVPAEDQERLVSTVRHLAVERFRGSPDTVHGKLFAFGATGSAQGAKRYLLVLPYGDRESSAVNDTAAFYVITLSSGGPSVSPKYVIRRGRGGTLAIVRVSGLAEDTAPRLEGCIIGVNGRSSVFALTLAGGALKREPRAAISTRDCPKLGQP